MVAGFFGKSGDEGSDGHKGEENAHGKPEPIAGAPGGHNVVSGHAGADEKDDEISDCAFDGTWNGVSCIGRK